MIADGRWLITILIAVNASSIRDIHIFKVGKIMLIKQADLIKNAFSVDACAGAGTKNTAGF